MRADPGRECLDSSGAGAPCRVAENALDNVFIEGLEVDTVIGVYDWEREIRQCLRLDLVCAWDNRRPAEGDDLAQALDYAALAERIQAFAAQTRFQLVETFAERLAALLKIGRASCREVAEAAMCLLPAIG